MVWQGLLVIGFLMIFLVKAWIGFLALLVGFLLVSRIMVFSLNKILGYDKLRIPIGGRF